MSNLYLKVKDVQLIETREFDAFSEEPKTVKHWLIKTDFANSDISVKINPENPKVEVVDLDKHDEDIKKFLLTLWKMSYIDLESAFGARDLESIWRKHTISEIQKMYDDWKKPKVGDEIQVTLARTFRGIILGFKKYGETEYVVFLAKGKSTFSECPLSQAIKTGRHFDNISLETLAEYVGV